MKIKSLILSTIMVFISIKTLAQNTTTGSVGIDTNSPTRTLDIDGDLRIRKIDEAKGFSGLLVPFDNPDNENNVVKKIIPQGALIYDNNAYPKVSITTYGQESQSENKFRDNSWSTVIFPQNESFKDDFTINSNGKLKVKKSGFYNIQAEIEIEILKDDADTFDGSYGFIRTALFTEVRKTSNSLDQAIITNSIPIYKGTKIPYVVNNTPRMINGNYVDRGDEVEGNNKHYLTISKSVFLPQDSYIYLQLYSYGAHSISSNLDNIKFRNVYLRVVRNL